MTKVSVRTLALAGVFVIVAFLGIGGWAVAQRAKLSAPLSTSGYENAQTLLAFASGHEAQKLRVELKHNAHFQTLVQQSNMVGAILLDKKGDVVLRGGELRPLIVQAALEGVSPMPPQFKGQPPPAARSIEHRMLFRDSKSGYTVVVVHDLAPLETAWKGKRRIAVIAAVLSVLLSPLFGFLIARAIARARAREAT